MIHGNLNINGASKAKPYPTAGLSVIVYTDTYEVEGTTYLRTSIGTGIPLVSGTGLDAIWDFSVLNDARFDKSNATYWGASLNAYFYYDAINPYHGKLKDFHYFYVEQQMTGLDSYNTMFLRAFATTEVSNIISSIDRLYIYETTLTGNDLLKIKNHVNIFLNKTQALNRLYDNLTESNMLFDIESLLDRKNNEFVNSNVVLSDAGISKGMLFNGINTKLNLSNINPLNGKITILAYLKYNSAGAGGVLSGSLIENEKIALQVFDTFKKLAFTSNFSTNVYSANDSISYSVKKGISIKRKLLGDINFYIDGKINGAELQNSGAPQIGGNILIGSRELATQYLDAHLYRIALYLDEISDGEIVKFFNDNKIIYDFHYNKSASNLLIPIQNIEISLIKSETITLFGDALCNVPIDNDLLISYDSDIGTESGNNLAINSSADNGYIAGVVSNFNLFSNISLIVKVGIGTKKILMVGDSTTLAGAVFYFNKLSSIFTGMTLESLGTQTTDTINHEGYSGKNYDYMVNNELSPFVKNGELDISAYFTDNTIATPDIVYLRLGINDIFAFCENGASEIDLINIIANINRLVNAFLVYDENLKVIVALPSISENTGTAWTSGYDPKFKQDIYINDMHRFWQKIIDNYHNSNYSDRVAVSFGALFLDRFNGYPNNGTTHSNAVHMNQLGYEQISAGDAGTFNKLFT